MLGLCIPRPRHTGANQTVIKPLSISVRASTGPLALPPGAIMRRQGCRPHPQRQRNPHSSWLIAPGATFPRFRSLKAFGRRPRARGYTCDGPASETLYKTGPCVQRSYVSFRRVRTWFAPSRALTSCFLLTLLCHKRIASTPSHACGSAGEGLRPLPQSRCPWPAPPPHPSLASGRGRARFLRRRSFLTQ
jgi:hypothetical protein